MTFSATAATPVEGTLPRPSTCRSTVPCAAGCEPPRLLRVSSSRAGATGTYVPADVDAEVDAACAADARPATAKPAVPTASAQDSSTHSTRRHMMIPPRDHKIALP